MSTHTNLFYVGDQDFEAKVLKADKPVIVDFWAEWCPPCRAIGPVFEQLSNEYQGQLSFAKMDIDQHPNTSSRLGVQSIPTLMIFSGGKMIGRMIGPHPNSLKNQIDRILADNGIKIA